MKALIATGYGDVQNLVLADRAEPDVGENDVKVRVHAASINPLDWKQLSGYGRGTALELHFPAILGRDASGDVLEVGANVKNFRAGDRVIGFALGTFAERVVAAQDAWAKLPRQLDVTAAAALPMIGLTGAQLADTVDPKPGMSVLVSGAAGGVGRVAVFVAKAAGATVWAGVRKDQKTAGRALGADHVVALDDDVEVAALPQFDGICDTVNGETIGKLLPHLKAGGALGSTLGEPAGARARGLKVTAIQTRRDPARLTALAQAAADGRLVVPVQRTFPLEQGAEAFRFARETATGKVLVIP